MTTRRPKPEASRWLIDQRKRRGWKPEDLADRLDIAVATVRGWESGRGIGPESLMRLEALFGVQSPTAEPAQGDLAAAVIRAAEIQAAATDRQTAVLQQIARLLGARAVEELSPEAAEVLRQAGYGLDTEPQPEHHADRPAGGGIGGGASGLRIPAGKETAP
jgi:transcriptional regulator with XRE-family HTH domain